MKKRSTLLMIALAISGLNSACQNVVSHSPSKLQTLSQGQALEGEDPKQAIEVFLGSLRDGDYEKSKLSSCLQKYDLTKLSPIGVKGWKIQQITEKFNKLEPNEKYFVAVVDVQAVDSAASWKLKVWNSNEFFVSIRRSTKELNDGTNKLNKTFASTGSQLMELQELPSRIDISPAPHCIERITPATETLF